MVLAGQVAGLGVKDLRLLGVVMLRDAPVRQAERLPLERGVHVEAQPPLAGDGGVAPTEEHNDVFLHPLYAEVAVLDAELVTGFLRLARDQLELGVASTEVALLQPQLIVEEAVGDVDLDIEAAVLEAELGGRERIAADTLEAPLAL